MLVVITSHFPYGSGETFLASELREIKRRDIPLALVPYSRGDVPKVTPWPVWRTQPALLSLLLGLGTMARRPFRAGRLVALALTSGSFGRILRNLVAIVRGGYLARLARAHAVTHIHVHWAHYTATMAMAAAELADIPWSLTVFRYDIVEENLLVTKCRSARFVRCTSERSLDELRRRVGPVGMLRVSHLGVDVPSAPGAPAQSSVVLCPAALMFRKGQNDLLDAAANLVAEGTDGFTVRFAGDGPDRAELETRVAELGLSDRVEFLGQVQHDVLLRLYESGDVAVVVLPTRAVDGDFGEGIPTALIEAMAYAVPVIATATGGTPELLDGAGSMIEPGNVTQLTKALRDVLADPEAARARALTGRARVEEEFEVARVVDGLIDAMGLAVSHDAGSTATG